MSIEFIIKEVSTYSDGYFKAIGPDGREVYCYLQNKARDWNKIFNYLNTKIPVKGSLMTRDAFLVTEIL